MVRDSSGAAIPGATIQIVSQTGSPTLDAMTDAQGAYRVTPLAPGPYRVHAALDGFDPVAREAAVERGQTATLDLTLSPSRLTESVVVTARRVEQVAQEVPIPLSVLSGELAENAGAFNVNRVKELIPTVQFYSSNPRNSSVTIRGIGAPFGLTNDGIEPGVGLYIDGVFFARPAAATLDFLDVERVEVLRGPQGTLFGKNTTAGAINVTSRRPGFTPRTEAELAFGSYEFVQAKGSVSGPLTPKLAGRLSFSGTSRDGFILNTVNNEKTNTLNNGGIRGQLLFAAVAERRRAWRRRSHPAAPERLRAGGGWCRADAASGEPAVCADCRRPQLRAAELQRIRPAHRHRHADGSPIRILVAPR